MAFVFTIGSEIAALGRRDVTVRSSGGVEYVGSFVRNSTTDQEEMGAFRSLDITDLPMCPVTRLKHWLIRMA